MFDTRGQIMKKLACILLLLVSLALSAHAGDTLIPGGNAVGLQLTSEGVSVVDFAEETPKEAGLEKGDRIVRVNGGTVTDVAALRRIVAQAQGAVLELTIERNGKEKTVSFAPSLKDDEWYLGIYVRDHISGVGTVTYFDPEDGTFAALGHGVCDGGGLLCLRSGTVLPAQIASVTRGRKGQPGALQGAVLSSEPCGSIAENTACGIFGSMAAQGGNAVAVASAQEVHTGFAVIRCTVSGTQVRQYAVSVTAVDANDPEGRNLVLKISDPALLEATGGIVQGMSGSPILQDGKLIGAVTHVLVSDPTRGYGILIETMRNRGSSVAAPSQTAKKVRNRQYELRYCSNASVSARPSLRRSVKSIAHGLVKTSRRCPL